MTKYTKDELAFARGYYNHHKGKITRELDDYDAYKSVCVKIRKAEGFSSYSWDELNKFLANKTANDYKSLATKYA